LLKEKEKDRLKKHTLDLVKGKEKNVYL